MNDFLPTVEELTKLVKVMWRMPPEHSATHGWCEAWKVLELPYGIALSAIARGSAKPLGWEAGFDEPEIDRFRRELTEREADLNAARARIDMARGHIEHAREATAFGRLGGRAVRRCLDAARAALDGESGAE